MPRGPPPLPGHRGPSGRAGRACGASARGHHGRPGRVSGDAHRVRRRRGRNRARPCRESERRVVPLGDGGQQNLRRGKGPHFHPAADGETLRGDCREAGTPLSCSSGVPLWGLGRGAERAGCPCMPGAAGDRRAGCGQTARTVRRGDAGVLSLPGLVRHRQPNGAGTDRPALTPWHQCSTLPFQLRDVATCVPVLLKAVAVREPGQPLTPSASLRDGCDDAVLDSLNCGFAPEPPSCPHFRSTGSPRLFDAAHLLQSWPGIRCPRYLAPRRSAWTGSSAGSAS